MSRKIVRGSIRNKEKTKQKILRAVGKILRTKGYLELTVSKIALVAGFDKKLIYEYFGSTDNLIDEYIRMKDYWSVIDEKKIDVDLPASKKDLLELALLKQFEGLRKNKELQKIMLWQLSENRPILAELYEQREEVGQGLYLNSTESNFDEKSEEYRASIAIVLAGIYHLNLSTVTKHSNFLGFDLTSEDDRRKIEKAISDISSYAHQII